MRGHRLVSDQDLPIRMRCIPDQLGIWSILSGNALIEGWSNPRAWTILDARGRSPMCGRVASPLLGRRSRGSLPRLPSVRKRSAVTGTLVGVRLQADQIKAIDSWAGKQNPPGTRPEAMLQIRS